MSSAQQLFEKVRGLLPWSVPIKLMLSALLGVLGGAGLLGYLSEYATYNYAIHYGFRPPLEGIPYLRPAVAFGSLFLLLTGAFVFASIAFILRSTAWYIEVIPRQIVSLVLGLIGADANRHLPQIGRLLTNWRERVWWQQFLIAILFTIATLAVIVIAESSQSEINSPRLELGLIVFLTVYIVAIVFAVLRPATIWWIAIIATASYFVVCVYLLFTPATYSQFLRILGYGGGLSVRLELRDGKNEMKSEPHIQQLMLRTNEAIILYDAARETYSEVPRDQVHRIVHDAGGMRKLPYLFITLKSI